MSRFAWEHTTKFRADSGDYSGCMTRFTYGVTKGTLVSSPYFSLTGETFAPFLITKEKSRREAQDIRDMGEYVKNLNGIHPNHMATYYKVGNQWWKCISCGQLHDNFRAMYPKYVRFLRWHLCQDGIPIHYESNGLYWLRQAAKAFERARGMSCATIDAGLNLDNWTNVELDENIATVEGHINTFKSVVLFDKENEVMPNVFKWNRHESKTDYELQVVVNEQDVRDWLAARMPRLQREYMADMEELKTLEL